MKWQQKIKLQPTGFNNNISRVYKMIVNINFINPFFIERKIYIKTSSAGGKTVSSSEKSKISARST